MNNYPALAQRRNKGFLAGNPRQGKGSLDGLPLAPALPWGCRTAGSS